MKSSNLRPVLLLGLLLVIPLAFLAWAGFRAVVEEERAMKQTLEDLLEGRLRELDERMQTVAAKYAQIVQRGVRAADSPAEMREMSAKTPVVRQFFVQDKTGNVIFPVLQEPLSEREQLFLQRTGRIFDEKRLLAASPEPGISASGKLRSGESYHRPDSGWFAWYWENGMQLLFWQKLPDGRLFGAEFSRNALLADLIAELPEHFQGDALLGSSTLILRDGLQQVVHRIGNRFPQTTEKPGAKIPLTAPLNTWVLEFYHDSTRSPLGLGQTSRRPFLLSLVAVGLTLILLAIVLWREHARELREAEQRVSFVNQVSHELKTPLTNIRLYAELLEKDLDPEEQAGAWRKLDIIVQESRRLSRLIANVLTFSKQGRGAMTIKPRLESPDEVIQSVVTGFLPALESRGIQLQTHLNAADRVTIDPDLLGQILGNLLSNVEKYAAAGGRVVIESATAPQRICVRVRDFGPGIPPGKEEEIFGPFCRLADHLSEGASGTGIGLHLSRELARAHGGDLRVIRNNGPIFPDSPQLPELPSPPESPESPKLSTPTPSIDLAASLKPDGFTDESSHGLMFELVLNCHFPGAPLKENPAKEDEA